MTGAEFVDILSFGEFKPGGALKKVPLMTEGIAVTTLFIDADGEAPSRATEDFSEVHYVVKGKGSLFLDDVSSFVGQGTLVSVPRGSRFRYRAEGEQMVVLTIAVLAHPDGNKHSEVAEGG